ncbi:hypothetical protein SPONL_1638 [uncultured Candidatus Thioglobus sp.]|nr:hypothetical protein SPONL_1638 [uncultured Candidatus Thioglobus sp.]
MEQARINELNALMHDKSFRKQLTEDPKSCADKIGFPKEVGYELKVVKHTKDTYYFVIYEDSSNIPDDILAGVNAAGPMATLGTAGSLGTATSTVSTVGSAGSALVINNKVYS